MGTAEVKKMDPCGYVGCDKMSVPGTDRCFIHDLSYSGMQPLKVKIATNIVIIGDDYQLRIMSSPSQPKYPERSYHLLYEDAYGGQVISTVSEAELNEKLATSTVPPNSVEEMLRMANQDRSMNEYSFPAPTPVEMKDI